MGIFLSAISAVSFGFADFFGGLASKRDNMFSITISREFFEGIIVVIVGVWFVSGTPQPRDYALGLGAGAIASVFLPFFYNALATGRMSVIAPVTGIVGATFPVLYGLFSSEHLSLLQGLGIAAAIPGIALVSVVVEEHEETKVRSLAIAKNVGVAALCGLGTGAFFIMIHHTSRGSGLWPNVFVSLAMVSCLSMYALVTRQRVVPKREVWGINFVGGATDLLGFTLFTLATRQGLLATTAVVTSLYPVITALLAVVILHEPFAKAHKAGLVLSVVSLALIGAGG